MEAYHTPVMLDEVIEGLNIKENGVYVDCTVGGGGHAFEIAKRLKNGKLYAFDRDIEAITASQQRLKQFEKNTTFIHSNYKEAPQILSEMGTNDIDGFLVDLGVSSHQIDEAERGFSFVYDGPLDMRMDRSENTITAKQIVNNFTEAELVKLFYEYGEEEFSKSIAKNIVAERKKREIDSTFMLKDIIEKSMPKSVVYSRGGASKKVFQALRIYVNRELEGLEEFVKDMLKLLKSGGRACILTFHSLEDRIVKKVFKEESTGCICPPKTPICICGHKASVKPINRKPITASEEELKQNSRSTSAKLRIVEKL